MRCWELVEEGGAVLDFTTWRELVTAFVAVEARRGGWSVVCVQRSRRTASVYVKLEHDSGATARIRVSDHVARGRPESELHVRQSTMGRLFALSGWLADRLTGRRAEKILPSDGHQQHEGERLASERHLARDGLSV